MVATPKQTSDATRRHSDCTARNFVKIRKPLPKMEDGDPEFDFRSKVEEAVTQIPSKKVKKVTYLDCPAPDAGEEAITSMDMNMETAHDMFDKTEVLSFINTDINFKLTLATKSERETFNEDDLCDYNTLFY